MRTLILNFHGLGEPHGWVGVEERPYWLDMAHFPAILDEVVEAARAGLPSVRLTFDDGNRSDLDLALPALRDRRLDATFFVCAGRLGRPGYLDGAALRELLAAGMAIGSHGMDHVNWRTVQGPALARELDEARKILEDVSGIGIAEASIPFGAYDRRVLRGARAAGFAAIYSSDGGLADLREWLRPRQTIERCWQGRETIARILRAETWVTQAGRYAKCLWKRLR